MRIALIVPGFSAHETDWAIPALQSLAVAMSSMHDVHLFSLRYPTLPPRQFGGFQHHATGGGERSGLASFSVWMHTWRAIIKQHRRRPFDLFHGFWADEPGLVAVLAGRMLRRPAIVSSAGGELIYLSDIQYGTGGSLFRRTIVRLALNGGVLITGGSDYQLDLCRQLGVPASRLRLAPLGLDTELFAPRPTPVGGPLTLIQAASFAPVKNQALLLDVFSHVRKRLPDARLRIVGAGPLQEELQRLAIQMGLSGVIDWPGKIYFPEMPDVFCSAHIYVQTSRHESQGMAVLEAMACGLPVLGTPVGILREVASSPPSWEPEELAEGIVSIWQDASQLERQGSRARQIAADHYSMPATLSRFLACYQELL